MSDGVESRRFLQNFESLAGGAVGFRSYRVCQPAGLGAAPAEDRQERTQPAEGQMCGLGLPRFLGQWFGVISV